MTDKPENPPAFPILLVKPKALRQCDRRELKARGIVVVEVDDPSAVRFVYPEPPISGFALAKEAAAAILSTNIATHDFGARVAKAMLAARQGGGTDGK